MSTSRRLASEQPDTEKIAPSNGQPKTPKVIAGTTLPAPTPDSEVDIVGELADGVRIKYSAPAENIPQATPQPKISAEQLARAQARQYQQTRIRYTNLTEWLEFWRDVLELYKEKIAVRADFEYANVTKFRMSVTRKADPPLLPDQTNPFNNQCTTDRPLGEWPFPLDMNAFIGHLQTINNKSGGEFRVELRDAEGMLIARSWFDERNNPLEGQENATWEGQIPNPYNAQAGKRDGEITRKIPSIKDLITELKEQKENLKELGIIKEDTGTTGGNELFNSINAQAAAAVVTTLKETLTAIHSSAGGTGADKGFLRSLAEGDEGQKRIWSGFDNVTNLLHMVAADWMKGRNDRLQHKQRMEELKLIQENPHLAKVYEQQTQANKEEPKEDIFDYVCRACEEKRTDFTLEEPQIKNMNPSDVAMIRGALAKDQTPEQVLDLFITVAQFKGKGDRARALKSLPQTLQFIERLQRSVQGVNS